MKQFEQHPLYKKILQEEISRAQRLMFEYNEKEIWNTLTVNQREDALLAVDGDMGPDFADEYSEAEWLEIPDSITNRIDLRRYKQNDYVGAVKTFANIKDEMNAFKGFKELSNGGFSLPAFGLMGDVLGYYEFKDNNDQTVNVKKFDKKTTSITGEKNHPVSVFADFMEEYGNDYIGAVKRDEPDKDVEADKRSANMFQRGIYSIITDTSRFSNTKEMQEYVAKVIGTSASNLTTLKTALASYANANPGKMMQFNIDVQRMSKGHNTGYTPNMETDPNFNPLDFIRKPGSNWTGD